MNVPRICKVIVVLAALVVLARVWLRQSEPRSDEPGAPHSHDRAKSVTASQRGSPKQKHVRNREAQVPLPEIQEEGAVDFDWRQLIRDKAKPPKLPREEVEKYLERNKRNAVSLLAAYRALSDTNYLKEAANNFPDDPRVQLSVLVRNVFPDVRRHWLDLFEASAPDNSLANYLSAQDYFRSGQTEAAVNELLAATRKPAFKDYVMESRQEDEELNLAAGRSPLQSKFSASGWAEDLTPKLAILKSLSRDIAELQTQHRRAGEAQSADQLAQMGLALANRLYDGNSGKITINRLVGMAIEALTLPGLDQNARYDFLGGKTPNDRTEELKQQGISFMTLNESVPDAFSNATEAELLSYYDRVRFYGEEEAMCWLTAKQTTP